MRLRVNGKAAVSAVIEIHNTWRCTLTRFDRLCIRLIVATFFLVSSSLFAASIHFDDLEGGLNPPLPLPANASPYANFSTEAGAQLLVFSGAGTVGGSNPNTLTAGVNPSAFPYDSDVYVDFTHPVNELTFSVLSDNDSGNIAKVRVFTAGTFEAELDVVGDGNFSTPITIDLTSFADITRLEIADIIDEFGLSYDDFEFDNPVPEPSSFALLLGQMLVAACWFRKKLCKEG